MIFGLSIVLVLLIANVQSTGTIVDLGLFTKPECVGQPTAPYVGQASIGLGTCLSVPGAVSINVPKTACSGTNVMLYGYADSSCSGVSDGTNYYRGNGCYTWFNGAFGSIVLSCSTTEPGSVVSYTTVSAGPVATDPAGNSSTTGSTATGTNTGGSSSTRGTSSPGKFDFGPPSLNFST